MLRAKWAIGSRMRREFANLGVTPPQCHVVEILGDAGPEGAMQHEIAERLLVTCGNTTGLIDRLEEAGLVTRRPHPEDRRAILATLTDQGRELYARAKPLLQRRIGELLAIVTPERGESMIAMLDQIVSHVESLPEPPSD